MISRWRTSVLTITAGAVLIAACASSSGVAEPPTTATIPGVGVPPSQEAALGEPQGSQAPPSSFVLAQGDAPEITDNRVFMVGDSVMQAMTIGRPDSLDYYVGALGWRITVDAMQGRFTDQGLRVLQKRRSEVHQVVVLMLGNNYNGDEADYESLVRQILSTLSDAKKIVMFTVPLYEKKQAEVNDVLLRLSAEDPRLVLIDWETITRTMKGVLSGDRLHPTVYGADVLAQLIGDTLGPAPGAPPEVTIPVVGTKDRPPLPDWVNTDKGEGQSTGSGSSSGSGSNSGSTATTKPRKRRGGSGSGGGGGTATTSAPAATDPPVQTAPPPKNPEPPPAGSIVTPPSV